MLANRFRGSKEGQYHKLELFWEAALKTFEDLETVGRRVRLVAEVDAGTASEIQNNRKDIHT